MSDPLRVLNLSAAGLPWTLGGRDVFVHEYARALLARGVEARCAFHQTRDHREPPGAHEYDGVRTDVLPPLPGADVRSNISRKTTPTVPGFAELLAEFRPHVVHLHDFTEACNLSHIRSARAAGARVVMTYHSPGQSCPQKELMYRGRTPCDGELRPVRCGECRLTAAGLPAAVSGLLARVPVPFVGVDSPGRLARTLSSPRSTRLLIASWHEMVGEIDLIHTHAEWVRGVMRLNGVPEGKLCMHRTGLPRPAGRVERVPNADSRLRVAFLGRCDRVKGIETLIDAVRALPELPAEVAFYGPGWTDDYGRSLLRRVGGDTRFREPVRVPPTELPRVWSVTDVLAVPSLWPETGPLVVLEAFAAGVPVVGSDLGGIPELVRDGVDGVLVPPGDIGAMSGALRRLAGEPGLLEKLRAGVRPPRTLGDLAGDLLAEYGRLAALPPSPPLRGRGDGGESS